MKTKDNKTATLEDNKIPALESASKERATLLAKHAALIAELKQIDAEREKLAHRPIGINERDAARIASIIDDVAEADQSSNAERIKATNQRAADLRNAVVVVEQRLATDRNNASRVICQQLAQQHNELAARIVSQMLELNTAANDYRKFRDAVQARDVAWFLPPVSLKFTDAVRSFLYNAANDGLITKTQIPAELC